MDGHEWGADFGEVVEVPKDVVKYPAAAHGLETIRDVLRSDRPIQVTWPGGVIEDSDGYPLGMSLNRIIHPGQAEPVPGEWSFREGDDLTDPWE